MPLGRRCAATLINATLGRVAHSPLTNGGDGHKRNDDSDLIEVDDTESSDSDAGADVGIVLRPSHDRFSDRDWEFG